MDEILKLIAQRAKAYDAVRMHLGLPPRYENFEDGDVPQTTAEAEGEKGGAVTLRIMGALDWWFGFDYQAAIRELDRLEPT